MQTVREFKMKTMGVSCAHAVGSGARVMAKRTLWNWQLGFMYLMRAQTRQTSNSVGLMLP